MGNFNGKALSTNYVIISPKHEKYELLYLFKNNEEASDYYESFDVDKETLSFKTRLKVFLCKHKEEDKIDHDLYYYMHCKKCNRAIFVDNGLKELYS